MGPGSVPPDFGFGGEGALYRLSQLRGFRRVLLAFCPDSIVASCQDGIRAVKQNLEDYRKRELVAIVVSPVKEEELTRFAREEPMPIILISDERQETISAYGVRGMKSPVVFLIDKEGIVQASWARWPSTEEIFEAVDSFPAKEAQGRSEAA
jgi:peroxiredoxin